MDSPKPIQPAQVPRPSRVNWIGAARPEQPVKAPPLRGPESRDELRGYVEAFRACDGAEYGWVLAHAEKQATATGRNSEILDTKATQLIAFLGTAVSVSVALSGVAAKGAGWLPAVCAVPAMLLAILAATVAVKVLNPRSHVAMPTVRKAIQCAEADEWSAKEATAQGFFARLMHQSIELEAAVVSAKAADLERAFRLAVAALWALLIPLAAALASGFHP